MQYGLKIVIDGRELHEYAAGNEPYVGNVQFKDSTSLDSMGIGATASNSLYFTLYNPYLYSFDGANVELYILENGEDDDTEIELNDNVSDDGAVDLDESEGIEDDFEDDDEDMTDDDEADEADEEQASIEAFYNLTDGEELNTEDDDVSEVEESWRKIGEFYVSSQYDADKRESTYITCLDAMSKLNADYVPANATCSVQSMYEDLRSQILENYGITVEDYTFDQNHEIDWVLQMSYRDALGIFAGLAGGYATCDTDGDIMIDFYTISDDYLIEEDLLQYKENASGEKVIEGFKCDTSINAFSENFIYSDAEDGSLIEFANPYVTEEILNNLYETYHGIRFTGAKIKALWNDGLRSGEFIRLFTLEERQNFEAMALNLETETDETRINDLRIQMAGLGKIILVSNQTIDFNGEATTLIDSIAESYMEKLALIQTETYKMFKNIYAEKIKAERIDVEDLFAQEITAKRMRIESDGTANKVVIDANGDKIINVRTDQNNDGSDDTASFYVTKDGKVIAYSTCRNTRRDIKPSEDNLYPNCHNYGTRIVNGYITSSGSTMSFMIPLGLRSQYDEIRYMEFKITGRCNGEYAIGSSSASARVCSGDGGNNVTVYGSTRKVHIVEMVLTPDKDFLIVKLRAQIASGASAGSSASFGANNHPVSLRLDNILIEHSYYKSTKYDDNGVLIE